MTINTTCTCGAQLAIGHDYAPQAAAEHERFLIAHAACRTPQAAAPPAPEPNPRNYVEELTTINLALGKRIVAAQIAAGCNVPEPKEHGYGYDIERAVKSACTTIDELSRNQLKRGSVMGVLDEDTVICLATNETLGDLKQQLATAQKERAVANTAAAIAQQELESAQKPQEQPVTHAA